MPVILVVDDSETDRALIRGLLGKLPLDWVVEFSECAEDAIVMLDETAIDLVLTDMMMPGMNGLQLVELVRNRPCRTPVILMSGQGSESLAVEAIQKGAASYVPKASMTSRLVETVKQVLEARQSVKSYDQLLADHVEDIRYRFRLNNDPDLIPPVVRLIQDVAAQMNLLSGDNCTRIGVAVDEAIINAMYHGNLELSPKDLPAARRKLRDGERVEAIDARCQREPYSSRRVHVEVNLSYDTLRIAIRDDGPGFDPTLQDDDREHRGLTLVQNLVDEVTFNDRGNEVRFVKHRDDAGDEDSTNT